MRLLFDDKSCGGGHLHKCIIQHHYEVGLKINGYMVVKERRTQIKWCKHKEKQCILQKYQSNIYLKRCYVVVFVAKAYHQGYQVDCFVWQLTKLNYQMKTFCEDFASISFTKFAHCVVEFLHFWLLLISHRNCFYWLFYSAHFGEVTLPIIAETALFILTSNVSW